MKELRKDGDVIWEHFSLNNRPVINFRQRWSESDP